MAGRESEEYRSERRDGAHETASAAEGTDLDERKAKLDADVDALLDEIDDVLEENAEEFVRGFVQKGGQ